MSKKDPKNEGPICGSPRTIPSPGNVLSTIALESLKFEKKFNNLTINGGLTIAMFVPRFVPRCITAGVRDCCPVAVT